MNDPNEINESNKLIEPDVLGAFDELKNASNKPISKGSMDAFLQTFSLAREKFLEEAGNFLRQREEKSPGALVYLERIELFVNELQKSLKIPHNETQTQQILTSINEIIMEISMEDKRPGSSPEHK